MSKQPTRRSVTAAAIIAVVTMLCAGFVLRKTFGDPGELPMWSLVLAAVWFAGGIGVLAAAPRDDRPTPRFAAHPWAVTGALAGAVSLGSFVGGWVLLLIPATSEWISAALLTATSVPLAITVLVALITGAAEEVFFRLGFATLWRGWWRWVVPNLLYLLVTLATGNVALALVAPVLGVAATASRELTGRWWAPIVVHAVWTVAMVALFPLSTGLS